MTALAQIAAADLLNDRVVPFFEAHGVRHG
jgi:hypothetical protein